MSTTDMTAEEMFEDLTGLEETLIAAHFGDEPVQLAQTRPTAFVRSLVFAHLRRAQLPNAKNKLVFDEVQNMRLGDVNTYFAESAEEIDLENPVTAEGEGVALEH
ncbi:hypothetical protein [Nocardioides sp.]|uniref:hypothetical protein n=1 Tax=Nocardioides sp. TaxID=35761 RepID=UPI0026295E14|nr:hypothetical protein [Nocardioides sp.]MDI6908635.1 hypothetical protein [Nocardioides sp.]